MVATDGTSAVQRLLSGYGAGGTTAYRCESSVGAPRRTVFASAEACSALSCSSTRTPWVIAGLRTSTAPGQRYPRGHLCPVERVSRNFSQAYSTVVRSSPTISILASLRTDRPYRGITSSPGVRLRALWLDKPWTCNGGRFEARRRLAGSTMVRSLVPVRVLSRPLG